LCFEALKAFLADDVIGMVSKLTQTKIKSNTTAP
jgi:hypothetical protein